MSTTLNLIFLLLLLGFFFHRRGQSIPNVAKIRKKAQKKNVPSPGKSVRREPMGFGLTAEEERMLETPTFLRKKKVVEVARHATGFLPAPVIIGTERGTVFMPETVTQMVNERMAGPVGMSDQEIEQSQAKINPAYADAELILPQGV